MDFGLIDTKGMINGLIGLDILIDMGAIIDLKNLTIQLRETVLDTDRFYLEKVVELLVEQCDWDK